MEASDRAEGCVAGEGGEGAGAGGDGGEGAGGGVAHAAVDKEILLVVDLLPAAS